jgi:signal transduction histidine kinase
VDALLDAWRQRALTVLLRVFCAITLFPLLALLAGRLIVVPWPLRAVCALLYLVLLTATLCPRLGLRRRASALIGCVAVASAIQLLEGRLSGNGRIALLLLPFLTLVLVGPRAGWAAAATSAALFAAVPLALQSAWVTAHVPGVTPNEPLPYWGLQWLLWVNIVAVLMTLLSRFERLQRRTMIAERMALRQLEAETADRLRLEEEIGRIGEEERRRLGAELHDGLCQHLTAALLNCSAMESQRPPEGAADAGGMTQLRVALEDAIGMAYDVAKGLCPVDMDPDALLPALERLCQDVRARHGIACRVQADRAFAIRNPEQALHLYRIAREAVVNTVKHARCTRLAITLEHAGTDLVLTVTDDGRQAAPGVAPVPGLGLRIMGYRAKQLGGTLQITGTEEGGMRVICRVPGLEDAP